MTSPPNIGSRRRSPTIVALYERLVRNGQLRRHTALAWLRRHFPDDAKNHLERIVPHSEQWFSIGDRVEPAPHEIARSLFPCGDPAEDYRLRSEEHTSELQSLMRISYAVFCLKTKK